MKKSNNFILGGTKIGLCFLMLLLSFSMFSQSCLPQGISFTSQAQIDSFPINYPGCTEIEGPVTISGSNIKNLLAACRTCAPAKIIKFGHESVYISRPGPTSVNASQFAGLATRKSFVQVYC